MKAKWFNFTKLSSNWEINLKLSEITIVLGRKNLMPGR